MDNQMLGLKEIYNCVIKATYDIELNGKIIKAGEPITVLDSVQMSNFQEIKKRHDARGGFNNQSWVTWESTQSVQLNFTQGIFSKVHFALLGNSKLQSKSNIEVPKEEMGVEIDEKLEVTLKHEPSTDLYIYNSRTSERITEFERVGKVITFTTLPAYTEVDIYYDFIVGSSTLLAIGSPAFSGFLTLTAKTRLKDDVTGNTVTGVFKIPKMRLVSDFSIRLGNDVPPSIGNFRMEAVPTGSKGNTVVMEFIVLEDDIDSDI